MGTVATTTMLMPGALVATAFTHNKHYRLAKTTRPFQHYPAVSTAVPLLRLRSLLDRVLR